MAIPDILATVYAFCLFNGLMLEALDSRLDSLGSLTLANPACWKWASNGRATWTGRT
jgi:hypothetical protein